MMAGNPNSWSMNSMHPQFVYGSNSSTSASSTPDHHRLPSQDFPVRSGSQLLLGVGEEASVFHEQKKMENWDEVVSLNPGFPRIEGVDVKQENAQIYDEFKPSNSWPVSSPTSCITSLSNSILNFSAHHHHNQEHSSECNSGNTGGVSKKARVQQSSAQPALKVRKEKLGDRITALHQLVSPFGKTDTASVLSEAIGYIRFLQTQIEALSSPYMRNASVGAGHHPQHSVQERNCLFSEEGGQDDLESGGELRSRGLCLVPISCTQNVGTDSGADYWAPSALAGDF